MRATARFKLSRRTRIALGHDNAAVTKEVADLAERNAAFDQPGRVLASQIVEAHG